MFLGLAIILLVVTSAAAAGSDAATIVKHMKEGLEGQAAPCGS